MKSALARIAGGNAVAEGATTELAATATEQAAAEVVAEPHSPYLTDLYGVIDEIETLFPEVVRTLRERIADLERFLARSENPYIQHGAIAATHEVVQAIHRVIKRIAGTHQSGAPEN